MNINHLNLVVNNLSATVSFFETYFDFNCIAEKGQVISVLKNPSDFTLVIMKDKQQQPRYPENFHLGFMLDSPEKVDNIHKKLVAGKVNVEQLPGKIRDSYGFYFHFDNLFIEVGHYLK